MRTRRIVRLVTLVAIALAAWTLYQSARPGVAAADRFVGPTSSQTLALSADGALLIVANPDNNSVSLFDVRPGYNTRLIELPVGVEPNGVAFNPQGTRAYVANTVSGTVSVLEVDPTSAYIAQILTTITVGTEPYGVAVTPAGSKVYVTNARSNSVSVINTSNNQVTKTITDVGFEPRGIAITNRGSSDAQETVFVTQFLSLPIAGKIDGNDDAKNGFVTAISAATDTVIGQVTLNPIADTGFKAAGDALQRIAPPATPTPDDFTFTTGAYANQLNNMAILGDYGFVPNTGASPNGPVRFNVNTQSLLHVIDLDARTDTGQTINMHQAVAAQTATPRRFITQPWAIACKHESDECYVVSAASNIVVKVEIDPETGAAAVQNNPTDTTRVLQILTGKNPRGIVVNPTDTTAYVMNYISRDVTVIDLTGTVETVAATLESASLPEPESPEEVIHIGNELYNTSIGEFDPPSPGQPAITGRMSAGGWGSCASCHPFGLSDNVVWIFGAGPRRTVPQHIDFPPQPGDVNRPLNWSAIFDEEEDFEANIRGVSGGQGLIVQTDGVTQDATLAAFTPANRFRNQLKVRGIGAWDAIRSFVQSGIRSPISPLPDTGADIAAGRQLFIQSNCQSCHGGPQWSTSSLRHVPPPDPSLISAGQLIDKLRDVGTFDPEIENEVRANATAPLGANGFNPAPLLSLFAFPQTFLHNGILTSLDAVLENVEHRTAGTGGQDFLVSADARRQMVQFLLSIDDSTEPIAPDAPGEVATVPADSYEGSTLPAEGIVSAFGTNLSTEALRVPALPLPVRLGGSTVGVLDSAGIERLSPLFYVGPGQINFQVPPGTALGNATITVTSNSGAVSVGSVTIEEVVPGIFTANSNGEGVPAATGLRAVGSARTNVQVYQCAGAAGCTPTPIDLGPEGDRVFLTLFGSGIRNRSSLANVQCAIGGENARVTYAGDQGGFVGLDQVNLELPTSLRGRGEVTIELTVDGKAANPVIINVQ